MREPAPPLTVVADLHLEVSGHRGSAIAHLHNDVGGLVLDVDSPAALVRALPPRNLLSTVGGQLAGLSFRVRSDGVELGTVSITGNGSTSVRPTLAGTGAAVRLLAHEQPVWVIASAVAGLVALLAAGRRILR